MLVGDMGSFFVDFERIWGACLESFWQHWGSLLFFRGFGTSKWGSFLGVCFDVCFLDDFGSDYGVSET